MQIDGLRQAHESFGNIGGGVGIATRQQIGLDRELETSIDARRGPAKRCSNSAGLRYVAIASARARRRPSAPCPFCAA